MVSEQEDKKMHAVRIVYGSDLCKIESDLNAKLSEFGEIEKVSLSMLYCRERDIFVFTMDVTTPDYLEFKL